MTIKTVETENEGLKRAFMLTIPAKDIEARVDQEVKRLAPQVRMPGFRPGKVPPNLIRKMHGDSLQREALSSAVQTGVQQLLQEQKLRPATQPEVELDEQYEPGKDAEVHVRLEALPEVPTPNIDGLKIERLTVEPDDSVVDEQVQRLVEAHKSWKEAPKDHAAENGDLLVIDFEGKVNGESFEGGQGDDMSIELGSGRLIPGFEDQLVGAKAGEQRDVKVTFPNDYPAANLKGKSAVFDVKVKAVKTATETKADDDFAKSLGLNDLEQLRGLVRDQLGQELNGLTRTHMKRQLLDQLAARSDFAVPPSMVEAEFQSIMQQLRHEASQEADPGAALSEIEQDADQYRSIAERRVRLGLLLSEIGAANGVDVTEAEMNRLIAQAASQHQGKDRDRFIQYVQQEPAAAAQLRAPLYEDKVVDFLFSKAEISERSATREQLEADLDSEEGHVHGPDCGHEHAEAAGKPKGNAKKGSKAKAGDAAPAVEAEPAKPKGEEKPKAKKGAGKATESDLEQSHDPIETSSKSAKKAKVTADKATAPKPAKPLKSEPHNEAAAKAVKGDAKPKKAPAKKGTAKKAK